MMLSTTFESSLRGSPKTLYPIAIRFITLAAAIFIVALVGGILIQMVNHDPLIGYPAAVSLQTEVPGCAVSTENLQAESARLVREANTLLDAQGDPTLASLLSICSLKTAYSFDADAALQKAMDRAQLMPMLQGHTGDIFDGQFSPDGQYIVTASWDGTARLWDAKTLQEIRQYKQPALVMDAVFSPDGKYILTSGNNADLKLRLWDTQTGTLLQTLTGHTLTIVRVLFSADGKYGVSAAHDNTARLWNLETGQEIQKFRNSNLYSIVAGIAFSPDGQHLLVGSGSAGHGLLEEWDIGTGKSVRQISDASFSDDIWSVDVSPDGKYILTAGNAGAAMLDYQTGKVVRMLRTDTNLSYAAFSPDGRFALVADGGPKDEGSTTARLYDVATGQALRVFTISAGGWGSFSPDGRRVVTTFNDFQNEFPDNPSTVAYLYETDINDFITDACSKMTRDFTADERTQYGLGEGAACP